MGIQFKQVSYAYRGVKNERYEAILNIDLEIKDGEFVAIIGHTGSGKTTLVQHMNALLEPTRGEVHIFDYKLPKKKKRKGWSNKKMCWACFSISRISII